MMAKAEALDPADETFREYQRVVDAKYLDEIRAEAKQFSTKLLSRRSRVAECAIRRFKNGKVRHQAPHTPKADSAIRDLQNKRTENAMSAIAIYRQPRFRFWKCAPGVRCPWGILPSARSLIDYLLIQVTAWQERSI